MTKEQAIQGYLMNSPKVVAEMLYDTIEKYENRSCDNCKYWFYKTLETNIETCNFGLISHDYQSDSFCCNKWEAKNENL